MACQKSVTATITLPITAEIKYTGSYGEKWDVEEMRNQLLNFAESELRRLQHSHIKLNIQGKPEDLKITLKNFD